MLAKTRLRKKSRLLLPGAPRPNGRDSLIGAVRRILVGLADERWTHIGKWGLLLPGAPRPNGRDSLIGGATLVGLADEPHIENGGFCCQAPPRPKGRES